MTDETDPKPAEDEPKPPADIESKPATAADIESKPTPAAYATDVVNVGASKADEDDDDNTDFAEEPAEASRLSPFSVAAFAVSLFALFQAPQNLFTAQGLQASQFWRYILPTMFVPLGSAIVGLYLSMRASEEVYVGRLGGVGYLHAARIVSIFVLLVCLAASILVLFFSEAPQQPQFG